MIRFPRLIPFLLLIPAAVGCVRDPDWPLPQPAQPEEITDLIIPPAFDFSTVKSRRLEIRVLDNRNTPMERVPVEIFSGPPSRGGVLIGRGVSGANGVFPLTVPLPVTTDSLFVHTPYIGLAGSYQVGIRNDFTQVIIGGETPGSQPNVVIFEEPVKEGTEAFANGTNFSGRYKYMGAYDNQGVPAYKLPVRDYISKDLLDLVNNSLPEASPVPTHNPQYIANDIEADTRLRDSAEVFVTFVHEGASWRNALGYYVYDLSNPPASSDDIDTLYLIFPNVSYLGSGGGLLSGDKVKLGNFSANTGIGWFLVPNGWSNNQVLNRTETKFSNKNFNTFTQPAYRSHVALLKDTQREILLMGMEDISRPGGDNDFNDAVFYITANPFSAIITDNLAEAKSAAGDDDDGDGIINQNDAYPNDPERAFDIFLPGQGQFGGLAFEDLWPYRGDYDMNDLVLDYSYHLVTNTANRVVDFEARFVIKAVGASIKTGFGFSLNLPPAAVASISGQRLFTNEIVRNLNGTEASQSNSVIMVFDDAHRAWNQPAGRFINTELNNPYVTPDTLLIRIQFTAPQIQASLGLAPFNPFIYTGRGRGYEVHLPDHLPTDLADLSLLGTGNDRSEPGSGRYYKDATNLPFAMHIPVPFVYPTETTPIHTAHLRFANWAQSGGASFVDWYTNKTGYRNNEKLYLKQ